MFNKKSSKPETINSTIQLIGEKITVEEISTILNEISHAEKWTVEKMENDEKKLDFFKKSFNINIELETILASCKQNDNQDICSLIFYCLPGNVFIELQTKKLSYNSEKLITNKELESFLFGQI